MAKRFNKSGGFQEVVANNNDEAELLGLGRVWSMATNFQALASASGEECMLAIVNGPTHEFRVDSVFASMQETQGVLIRTYARVTTHNAPAVQVPTYLNGSKPQTAPFFTAFRSDGTDTAGIVGGSLLAQAAIDRRASVGQGVGVILAPNEIFCVTAFALAANINVGVTVLGHAI